MLRALERSDEALSLDQAALGRLAAASPKAAFADQDKWAYAARLQVALTLAELGRVDEAIAVLGGGEPPSSGGARGAQAVDHAGLLITAGHPAEALQELASPLFDQEAPMANPFQLAYVHAYRGCADALLGRTAALSGELDYLAAHRNDSEDAGLVALLCADKQDAFAAEVVARLADPNVRDDMLLWLCESDIPPHFPPFEKMMNARLATIRARPDVQAAVAKVGHVERFHLSASVFVPF